MRRIEEIRKHPVFAEQMREIANDERDRIFCGHDMDHLLAVARIGYILSREEFTGPANQIPKEMIYAAALLHDIGRHMQYSEGLPHNEAGAELAEGILRDTGFSEEEIREIVSAIRSHRKMQGASDAGLAEIIYLADKKSRACYMCAARNECNWPEEKMNLTLIY